MSAPYSASSHQAPSAVPEGSGGTVGIRAPRFRTSPRRGRRNPVEHRLLPLGLVNVGATLPPAPSLWVGAGGRVAKGKGEPWDTISWDSRHSSRCVALFGGWSCLCAG